DLKPKSDLRLLYTLSNVLIEKGWIDEEFIKNSTEDFEGFKNHVKKYDVNRNQNRYKKQVFQRSSL
ncbi:MAG: hypothetical protein KH433_02405, partial [Campylobacter concisus]|nr:hypothetical protein [Campylobacter concisus]